MSDQSQQPKYVEKRVRYFDGQYLDVDDFVNEQQYHIDRQRRISRVLCVSGILEGLEVKVVEGNTLSIITSGAAINSLGQQILLSDQVISEHKDDFKIDLSQKDSNQLYNLLLSWNEIESDPQKEGDSSQNRRFQEFTKLTLEPQNLSIPPSSALLATLKGNGTDLKLKYSGLRLPTKDKEGKGVTLTSQNGANDLAILSGSLSITGGLNVDGILTVTGNSTLTGSLTVNSTVSLKGSANATGLTINNQGNVGIGTTNPSEKLEVSGNLKVTGAITPSAGNGESYGIMFPKDPGGGIWDTAYIRYYVRDGEKTTLEIGTTDNADDHIALMPGKGNVGIATTTPSAKLEVVQDGAENSAVFKGGTGILIKQSDEKKGLKIIGDCIQADSTDLNQDIILTPKGTGKLSVKGTISANAYETSIYQAPEDETKAESITLQSNPTPTFKKLGDLLISFNIPYKSTVIAYYQIATEGTLHIVTRLMLNSSRELHRTLTGCSAVPTNPGSNPYFANSGFWMGELDPGNHSIQVQYRTPGMGFSNSPGNPIQISINQSGNDWQYRILRVMVLGLSTRLSPVTRNP